MGASQNDDTTSPADAARIVAMARDGGVNFIDTADEYTLGESERVVGQVIAGERDHWMLATKACNQFAEYLAALEFELDAGDEALIDGLVAIGHPLTPGYSHPEYPIEGRVPDH